MFVFSIVVAVDDQLGIGQNNDLPWHLPPDMAHFKSLTTTSGSNQKNVVVMGRKTYESIPDRFRPLPDRTNLVISRSQQSSYPKSVVVLNQFASVERWWSQHKTEVGAVFVIGGAQLYEAAINHPGCEQLYVTRVQKTFPCNRFFPEIPSSFQLISATETQVYADIEYRFEVYQKLD